MYLNNVTKLNKATCETLLHVGLEDGSNRFSPTTSRVNLVARYHAQLYAAETGQLTYLGGCNVF